MHTAIIGLSTCSYGWAANFLMDSIVIEGKKDINYNELSTLRWLSGRGLTFELSSQAPTIK